jgi:hypothetical protein
LLLIEDFEDKVALRLGDIDTLVFYYFFKLLKADKGILVEVGGTQGFLE